MLRRAEAFDSGFHTRAICVPARFSQASLTLGFRSSSRSMGLARLPQPIWGAAGHCTGAWNMLRRSGDAGLSRGLSCANARNAGKNPHTVKIENLFFMVFVFPVVRL